MSRALLVLLGPTGTGKSDIALEVAERFDAEIVGCDAVQVYRELDAATGKPSPADRRRVAHHLIDCIDPRTDFSMADYVRRADAALAEIAARGRQAVVVGGTGLYLRGLLRGVLPAPPRDDDLRRRLRHLVERGGMRHLRHWLGRRDPESAKRIGRSDTQRTIRALELVAVGGVTWSERLRRQGSWSHTGERYPTLKIGLDMAREAHQARLDERVDRFFAAGLVSEVATLLERGVPPEANAFKAIGYREVLAAIVRGDDPAGVREEVRRSTRRYAKRQRTWFRSEPGVLWLDASRGDCAERILRLWSGTFRPA